MSDETNKTDEETVAVKSKAKPKAEPKADNKPRKGVVYSEADRLRKKGWAVTAVKRNEEGVKLYDLVKEE